MNYDSFLRPTAGAILGIKIVQSDLCVSYRQNRAHKKRRNQTEQYHSRINKKWVKRYGASIRPCMYRMGDGTIVMHPSLYEKLRTLHAADLMLMLAPQ